ncbi:hypothetical protein EON63_06950 [archaeon]|nr:MAG: hypothetical protein EON63_06950 [archaeon]
MVSGEDLVEHMLWIAAGKALPARLTNQVHVPFKGSAIESRWACVYIYCANLVCVCIWSVDSV